MNTSKLQTQLTWIPSFPFPFESVWSIFTKVIVLNEMSYHELIKLIKRENAPNHLIGNFTLTDWIDFERFATLLRIEKDRLMQGTFSQMGIVQPRNVLSGIRICSHCWALGYHCALFDVEAIKQCPLHKCDLTVRCCSCAKAPMFSLIALTGGRTVRKCKKCETFLPKRSELIELALGDQCYALSMKPFCEELIHWWRAVGENRPERDILLGELLQTCGIRHGRPDYRSWQLYQAQKWGNPLAQSWTFQFLPEPVQSAVLTDVPRTAIDEIKRNPDYLDRIRGDLGHSYRSLRRHIYKEFVKPHRRCCNCLARLSRQRSLSLDGQKTCQVSLAYLVWRMSIEGIICVAGLRFCRDDNFKITMMSPPSYLDQSHEQRVRWSYFAFFGILKKLSKLRRQGVLGIARDITYDNENFHWKAAQSRDFNTRDSEVTTTFWVLYPSRSALGELGCDLRTGNITCSKDFLFTDEHGPNDANYRQSSWESLAKSDFMFRLRNSDAVGADQSVSFLKV